MAFLRAYMRGDPGFFSFLKKVGKGIVRGAKAIAPAAVGFVPGVGPIASRLIAGAPRGASIPMPSPVLVGGGGMAGSAGNVLKGKLGPLARSAGGYLARQAMSRLEQRFGGRPATGLSVGPDFGGVKSGSSSTAPLLLAGGRRYRRMHVTNVRALRRAIRRVKGFAKIARQCLVYERKVRCRSKR